ncbi:hypothetical protein Tco_0276820 [Tanacetum coccineum]
METELWNLAVKEIDIIGYTKRFQELALLCPGMVTSKYKKIECFEIFKSFLIVDELDSSKRYLSRHLMMSRTFFPEHP